MNTIKKIYIFAKSYTFYFIFYIFHMSPGRCEMSRLFFKIIKILIFNTF